MSNLAVVTDDTPLLPGQVRFYCAAEPPLQAGGYQLRAQQTVDGLKSQPDNNSFGTLSPMVVSGPRFRLPPQDLQMVYPPANEVGNYEESLAHVVLRTRTLPWVRSIDGATSGGADEDGKTPPWMALLTLYPDELNGATPKTITVSQLLHPEDGSILAPTLIDADKLTPDEKDTQLLAVDIDLSVFRAISPMLSELPLLAHVREVNTDQKEVLNMVEDGWFSVVVGNRLPQTAAENTCFLVSLEGHQNHLNGGPAIAPQYKKIRLVSLAMWKFTAAAARGSFLDYLQNLCGRGGIDLLQPTHKPFPGTLNAVEQTVKEALEIGYIPLRNLTRSGEQTTSWYRGPLSPVPTQPDPLGPYFYSDRAIRYDQSNGLFNMAFASAWQIGQLLALSDAAFANALFQWRIGAYQKQQSAVASDHLYAFTQEWNLQARDVKQAGVTPVLLEVLSKVAGLARAGAAADVKTATLAQTIVPVQPHHRRDEQQLAGVVPATEWSKGLQAGDDPLYLLYRHLQQAAPHKA